MVLRTIDAAGGVHWDADTAVVLIGQSLLQRVCSEASRETSYDKVPSGTLRAAGCAPTESAADVLRSSRISVSRGWLGVRPVRSPSQG